MTAKGDFGADEWKLIQEGPLTAGMIVLTAEGGGDVPRDVRARARVRRRAGATR